MRIERVEIVTYALPFTRPYVTSRGTLERREMVLLRLTTDDGLQGLGEAVPLSLRGGDPLPRVERGLRRVMRRLRGLDVTDFAGERALAAAIDAFVHVAAGRRLPAPSRAAIEIALFDLAVCAAGVSLWRLLRAERAGPVRCNATLAAATPERLADEAIRWAERGFRTFKLKLGLGDETRQVEAARAALGADARIRVDANGSWSVDGAITVLQGLEPLKLELAEQPTAGLREMRRVREAVQVPLAADESVTSAKEAARAARGGACDLVTVKLSKVGGIGPASAIAAQLPAYLSSALDGPVGIAAAGHAAQALYGAERPDPGLAHGLATQLLFADSIASTECEVRDGHLHLPEGHGLGVELDPKALERCGLGAPIALD